ncbi:hypothetical protein [Streptacidiphilus jiangxiensis]|nr:hypothetical protein [Streptacidiphilus jiangxiensis]
MTKQHARKTAARQHMAATGKSYQAALKDIQASQQGGGEGVPAEPVDSATEREDFIDSVRDADLPEVVKVCLFELASAISEDCQSWEGSGHDVPYDKIALASAIGVSPGTVELCMDIAIETGWVRTVSDERVCLREPHADLYYLLQALEDDGVPIQDVAVYRGRLAAFSAETDRLRSRPGVSVRRLRWAMHELGYEDCSQLAACTGSPFARSATASWNR